MSYTKPRYLFLKHIIMNTTGLTIVAYAIRQYVIKGLKTSDRISPVLSSGCLFLQWSFSAHTSTIPRSGKQCWSDSTSNRLAFVPVCLVCTEFTRIRFLLAPRSPLWFSTFSLCHGRVLTLTDPENHNILLRWEKPCYKFIVFTLLD